MNIQFQLRNNKDGLFKAINYNSLSEVRRIIENGININSKDEDGWTPLMVAADKNNLKIVKLLVELGADLEQKNDEDETALMIATFSNSIDVSKYLISIGVNTEAKDKHGRTAYEIAKELYPKNNSDYLIPKRRTECSKKINQNNKPNKTEQKTNIKNESQPVTEEHSPTISNIEEFTHTDENKSPKPLELQLFFDLFFMRYKAGREIIKLSDIEDSYFKRFGITMDKVSLFSFISKYNSYHSSIIKELDNGDFIKTPDMKDEDLFLQNVFRYKKAGTIIKKSEIEYSFRNQFKAELSNDYLITFVKNYSTNNLEITTLSSGDFQINDKNHYRKKAIEQKEVSDITFGFQKIKKEFYDFLDNYFKNQEIDSVIQFFNLAKVFEKDFKTELRRSTVEVFINIFNFQNQNLEIKKTPFYDYKITIPTKIIMQSVESLFSGINFGKKIWLTDINSLVKEKFGIDFSTKFLNDFLYYHKNIKLEVSNNQTYFIIIPTKEESDQFLTEYFNQGDLQYIRIFTINELSDSFYTKFNSHLDIRDLAEWLKTINNNISQNKYYIQSYTNTIFLRKPIQTKEKTDSPISKISLPIKIDKQLTKYSAKELEKLNEDLQPFGLIFRTYNSDNNILTYTNDFLINEIAIHLEKYFSERITGHAVSLPLQIDLYNKLYDSCDFFINLSILSEAINRANMSMKEKQIIISPDSMVLYSSPKAYFSKVHNPVSNQYINIIDPHEYKMYMGTGTTDEKEFIEKTGQQYRDWNGFGSTPEEDDYGSGDE